MRITLVEKGQLGSFQLLVKRKTKGTSFRPRPAITDSLNPTSDTTRRESQTEELRALKLALTVPSHQPPTTTTTTVASPLIQLPCELRETICLFAILNTPTPTPLLITCQKLNMEAQPLLYHRPIKLSSQAKLFDWVNRSRAQNLKHVRNLTLQLTDLDMTLRSSPERSQSQLQSQQQHYQAPSAWSLYEDELGKFDAALRSLPSLTEITIVPPRVMHSQLLRGMYLSVLALIPRVHPCLKLLVVHDDEESVLKAVKALQSLPRVVFKDGGGGVDANADGRVKKALSPPVVRSPRGKSINVKVEVEN